MMLCNEPKNDEENHQDSGSYNLLLVGSRCRNLEFSIHLPSLAWRIPFCSHTYRWYFVCKRTCLRLFAIFLS